MTRSHFGYAFGLLVNGAIGARAAASNAARVEADSQWRACAPSKRMRKRPVLAEPDAFDATIVSMDSCEAVPVMRPVVALILRPSGSSSTAYFVGTPPLRMSNFGSASTAPSASSGYGPTSAHCGARWARWASASLAFAALSFRASGLSSSAAFNACCSSLMQIL